MPAAENHPNRRGAQPEYWEPVEEPAARGPLIAALQSRALEIIGQPFELAPDTVLNPDLPEPETLRELGRYDTIVSLGKAEAAADHVPLARVEQDHQRVAAWLDRFGYLTIEQLHRGVRPYGSRRWIQSLLFEMHRAGLVERRRAQLSADSKRGRGGSAPWLWSLSPSGFRRAKASCHSYAPQIPDERQWRRSAARASGRLVHDLHAAHWALAFGNLVLDCDSVSVLDVLTPRYLQGQLRPPRGQMFFGQPARGIELRAITLGDGYMFDGISTGPFNHTTKPDITLQLHFWRWKYPDIDYEIDLLVEVDRTKRPSYNGDKFIAYDEFLTGWGLLHPRVQELGTRPVVIFTSPDVPRMQALMHRADEVMTGRIGRLGMPETQWRYPGREHILFTTEELVHHGSMLAWRLPEFPRDLRDQLCDDTFPARMVTILPTGLMPQQSTSPFGA